MWPRHVAYWAHDGKHSQIARTEINTGSTSRLTDGDDVEPTCTADGSTLVFIHCGDHRDHCILTRKSIDSGQSLALYDLGPWNKSTLNNPTLSPDGTKVLFRDLREERDARDSHDWAMVVPTAGGDPEKLKMPAPSGEIAAFTWSADGKSILYARNEHGVGNIWSAPLDGRDPRKLTAFDSDLVFAFGVSPDNRLVISRGSFVRDVVLIRNAR